MEKRSSALVGAVVSLGIAASALADGSGFAPFVGAYHELAARASAARIEAAIDTATAPMNFVARLVAHKRLTTVNVPAESLRIVQREGELDTDFDGHRYSAPLDGSVRRNSGPDGKPVDVSYHVEGHTLRGRYVAADGEKRFDFVRRPDGRTLDVHVTVLSARLPRPVVYTLSYAVAGPTP
jgi:hypothetical protein